MRYHALCPRPAAVRSCDTMAAAAAAPAKSQAQTLAEGTWASYSQLLCKGDAGILKLYVSALSATSTPTGPMPHQRPQRSPRHRC